METIDSVLPLVTTFLLNALWQIPPVVAAALLGDRLLRQVPGRLRHLFWLSVLAACLLLPAASLLPARAVPAAPPAAPRSFALPSKATAPRPSQGETPQALPRAGAIAEPSRLLILPPLKGPLARLATLAYALSLLGFGLRLGRAWRRTRGLARRARAAEIPADSLPVVARCHEAFAIGPVEILESLDIPSPVTLGARRPVILLPPGFFATASADEVTSALGHEMAHVRRRDYAVHLVCELLLLPVAFHPVVRLVRRRLAETRELACDEAVLETLLRPRAYARSLLSLAAAAAGLPRPSITLGVVDAPFLEVRMKSILNPPAPRSLKRTRAALGAAFVLLAALGTAAASFPLRAAAEESPEVPVAAEASALNPCEGPGPRFLLAAEQTAWTNMVPPNQNGQTFTATRPRITGVEVDLITGNPKPGDRDTLTLTLATLGGDVLAQVHRTLASGRDGWVCFAMPPGGIDVTPGETLALRLEDTGKVIFGWRYGVDGYPRGHALWLNRPDRRFDRAFRVHDAISAAGEPR
jgi:beta-lactamase regulating signal transducer with metallopeptidase domain